MRDLLQGKTLRQTPLHLYPLLPPGPEAVVWCARKGLENREYKQEPPVPPGDPDSDCTPVSNTPEVLLRHPNWAECARELGLALTGMLGGGLLPQDHWKSPKPQRGPFVGPSF